MSGSRHSNWTTLEALHRKGRKEVFVTVNCQLKSKQPYKPWLTNISQLWPESYLRQNQLQIHGYLDLCISVKTAEVPTIARRTAEKLLLHFTTGQLLSSTHELTNNPAFGWLCITLGCQGSLSSMFFYKICNLFQMRKSQPPFIFTLQPIIKAYIYKENVCICSI